MSNNTDKSEPPAWAAVLLEQAEENADRIDTIEANADVSTVSRSDFSLTPRESRRRGKQIKANRRARRKVGPDADKSGETTSSFTLDPRKAKASGETDESDKDDEKSSGFTLDPREA